MKTKCRFCEKAYANPQNLKVHIKTVHLKMRPYVCEFCGKNFGQNSNKKKHQETCLKQKEFVCGVCEKAFSRSVSLKEHILLAHPHVPENYLTTERALYLDTLKYGQ